MNIKKNHLLSNKGIAEDIYFYIGFSLYSSRIFNVKSEDAWSKILKFEFTTLILQTVAYHRN